MIVSGAMWELQLRQERALTTRGGWPPFRRVVLRQGVGSLMASSAVLDLAPLDDAGQTARQIADQLGHARPSLTQDAYIGRKAKNPAAADALETIADDL